MPSYFTEDQIERTLLSRLEKNHGYELLDSNTSVREDLSDGSGRSDKRQVILEDRLREAAIRLNPAIPERAVDEGLQDFLAKRGAMSPVAANREVDDLIKNGVQVEFEDDSGRKQREQLRLIDFNRPEENRFLAVSQLWIRGDRGYRRPDVLIYVNGIPLVFIELKNSNVKLRSAYDDNVLNYRQDIPHLFHTNAFCILSNAVDTRVGSMTATWEHFFNWLRVDDEKEKIDRMEIREKGTSVERVIDGLLPPATLLDYVENFTLFHKETEKIIAQNHQFIGVNRAIERFGDRSRKDGKLGVFWHTQGSGKSFSMIFYTRKITRKMTGNFTFVVVTDRDDLDGQIYRNFLNTETVREKDAAQPKNSEQLRKYLGENKRIIFTLIQKFRYDKGKQYPLLSDRSDIIVIVDEAHRTQYRTLAENMRAGLPNAQYLAFTGTPLLGSDRKTNSWFGDYVSEYNFQQSIDDGATVPLFYQKRVPEVLIQNEDLSEEFYEILEEAELDDREQEKLEKRFAKETEVIRRDDRLERIARDIVDHFPKRGYLGKGLVISLDKFTAVRMHDKVARLWKEEIKELRKRIGAATSERQKEILRKRVDYMRNVEMAVVISEEAGEEEKFQAQVLSIKPHRVRMNRLDEHGHDIEHNFKDPNHPLQLAFVCAMWLTGFDAPTLSTLYIDKPMKDHTLMQTIARANRVSSHLIDGQSKVNGEIIDYYNVFRNMRRALRDYATGDKEKDDLPVQEKDHLFKLLDDAIEQGIAFCLQKGIDLASIRQGDDTFKSIARLKDYTDILLGNEEWRRGYTIYENTITGLYEACKPEILGRPVVRTVALFQYLRNMIDAVIDQQDVDEVARRIGELLDESVVVDGKSGVVTEPAHTWMVQKGKVWDLGTIDFEKLDREFREATHKNIEIADLKAFIEKKLDDMIAQNSTRVDFAERLQQIIDNYNAGSTSSDHYFDELLKFARDLKKESERHIREDLTEDELELFDLLKKEKMTKEETQKVRLAARALYDRLKNGDPRVLVQDWFRDTRSRSIVRSAVEEVLDSRLPETYDRVAFSATCDRVLDSMVEYASGGRKWG